MCQSPTAEIRRGKKEEEEEEEEEEERRNSMKILWSALLHRATIIKHRGGRLAKFSPRCDFAYPVNKRRN